MKLYIKRKSKRSKKYTIRNILLLFFILFFSVALLWSNKRFIKKALKKYTVGQQILKTYVQFTEGIKEVVSQFTQVSEADKELKYAKIEIDYQKSLGKFHQVLKGIGFGSFNDGVLLPYNKRALKIIGGLSNDSSFLFVNAKGIFADKYWRSQQDIGGHVFRRDKSGNVVYYWKIVDKVIDTILECHFKPVLSLTFMPDALASNIKNRNDWNKSNVSPPKDYNEWRNLVYQTVKHLEQRYGATEIENWYFEVWNEPDLPEFFWIPHPDTNLYPRRGDNQEYFKLYDYSVEGALEANPNIKIGGPAIAGDIDLFINEWADHCNSGINFANKRETRIDFISRHSYGSIEDEIIPGIINFINKAKRFGKNKFNNFKVLITEIGPSTKPKPWLNTRYVAAWIVKLVDSIQYLEDTKGEKYIPDLMCFWTKPVPINFSNHFGLVTALGNPWHPSPDAIVKRPAFNAFDALEYLGDERISFKGTKFGQHIHGIATKKGDKEIAVLLYHLNEKDHYNKNSKIYNIDIEVKNIPFKKMRTDLFLIDQFHSNGYQKWLELNKPKKPTPNQLRILQSSDDLQLVEHHNVTCKESTYNRSLTIQSNSVVLLLLTSTE